MPRDFRHGLLAVQGHAHELLGPLHELLFGAAYNSRIPMHLRRTAWLAGLVVLAILAAAVEQLPALGAGGLLHPGRHRAITPAPSGCDTAGFTGVALNGAAWTDVEQWIDGVVR